MSPDIREYKEAESQTCYSFFLNVSGNFPRFYSLYLDYSGVHRDPICLGYKRMNTE